MKTFKGKKMKRGRPEKGKIISECNCCQTPLSCVFGCTVFNIQLLSTVAKIHPLFFNLEGRKVHFKNLWIIY